MVGTLLGRVRHRASCGAQSHTGDNEEDDTQWPYGGGGRDYDDYGNDHDYHDYYDNRKENSQ